MKNLHGLVKSLKAQLDSESKRPSHRVRDEMKVKEERGGQVSDNMQTVGGGDWNLCKLYGSAFFSPTLLLLHNMVSASLSGSSNHSAVDDG